MVEEAVVESEKREPSVAGRDFMKSLLALMAQKLMTFCGMDAFEAKRYLKELLENAV